MELQALVDVQGREGVRAMLPSMGEFRFIVLAMHTQVQGYAHKKHPPS